MDVQGSQYHLLHGRSDWSTCLDPTAGSAPLATLWADAQDGPPTVLTGWEYDERTGTLGLRRDSPLFRRAGREIPISLEDRRGAGRDAVGSWFWISADRTCICWLPNGDRVPGTWWEVSELDRTCTCAAAGSFTSVCTCPPSTMTLHGLCVTTRQYLLVGYVVPSADDPAVQQEAGLLVFDLHAGGPPLRLLWPADGFTPFDLADCPDGGALVLDRTRSRYWRLDEHLRLPSSRPSRATTFTPADGSTPVTVTGRTDPTPVVVRDLDGAPIAAIGIEPGPGGSVLLMDADAARGCSTLFCFDGDQLRWQTRLKDVVTVSDPDDPDGTAFAYSVLAHDFCFATDTGPLEPPMLYVADAAGNQVIAFALDPDTGVLLARDEFLPLRRWAARALVRTAVGVHYDFGERWIPVMVFGECRFATTATLVSPVDFTGPRGVEGQTFDSRVAHCVWHRLVLDATIPNGTSVSVRARAADDPELLPHEVWRTMPVPYRRTDGSELPWSEETGFDAFELLFQHVVGRYLQIELTMTGNGRSTPRLRALRAWYPRFSYVERYLPDVFAENDSDAFLERFLANPEGLLTALEEKIEHSHLVLDPRTAPSADLPWLAAWFGLALDPLWTVDRRRFLIRHVDRFYRIRGTVSGLVATLRVYLDDVVDESVFCVSTAGGTAQGVRVVERFLTRETGGAAYGSPDSEAVLDPRTRVRDAAHRFDVLLRTDLGDAAVEMVRRIVETAKPAHTAFALRGYFDLFTVGQARLGLDTELGHGLAFEPMVPGDRPSLAMGYLAHPPPFDLTDRIVSDRDPIGAVPVL